MPDPDAGLTTASPHRTVRAWLAGLSIAAALMAVGASQAPAQIQPRPAAEAAPPAGPGLLGPRRRPDRPGMSRPTPIPLFSQTHHPPLHLTRPRRQPPRLHV